MDTLEILIYLCYDITYNNNEFLDDDHRYTLMYREYVLEYVFEELKKLIDYIQSVYTEITEEWIQGTCAKINLKKHQISDVEVNGTIYKNIMSYVQFLNEHNVGITLQLSKVCSYPVTARVKTQNSIEYKIQSYKTELHEYGKVPIIKCINDLFGIRILLGATLTFEEIHKFIEEFYPAKCKCIDSTKLDYKAVHLYFKKDNQSFPWELQIWNQCDASGNFASHKKYKQGYTDWEKESKEGGIIDG